MPLPLDGRVLSDKFRFVRKLGKGGMASVWLAVNMAVDREVAIKLIRPDVLKNDDLVARFRSEARAAGRIGHPNICEIYDLGVGPVGPYIVMESLRGKNLAQLIRERRVLSPQDALDVVLAALDGLEAAHARGIIHRDLKPENVFLHEPANGPPIVKLMDFGVAKFTDGSGEITTAHGALLGTPEYMAPEQFKGADQAEPRTDLWAVGAILYRALTGKHPFKGPTVAATLLQVTHEEAKPIRELEPDVPQALVDVVDRCLSKKIEDRYEDVGALRAALLEAIEFEEHPTSPTLTTAAGEPEGAGVPLEDERAPAPADDLESERRPTEAVQVVRDARRRRWLLPAGLAALAALGLAFALWPQRISPSPAPSPQVVPAAPEPDAASEPDAAPEPNAAPGPGPGPGPEPEPAFDPSALPPDLGTPPASPFGHDVLPAPPDAFELDDAPVPDVGTADTDPPPVGPVPNGVVDLGNGYVVAKRRGKRSDHGEARDFCQALDVTAHQGIRGWKLPFPGLINRIRDSKAALRGTYWTSARWRGNVTTFTMPNGTRRKGVDADRRSARALCVAPLTDSARLEDEGQGDQGDQGDQG